MDRAYVYADFLDTDFAAPRVVSVWTSVAEYQALAMRFTANVLFTGTLGIRHSCKTFLLLIDIVGLAMVLFGKRLVPTVSFALCDFRTITAVYDATISLRLQRPSFSRINLIMQPVNIYLPEAIRA